MQRRPPRVRPRLGHVLFETTVLDPPHINSLRDGVEPGTTLRLQVTNRHSAPIHVSTMWENNRNSWINRDFDLDVGASMVLQHITASRRADWYVSVHSGELTQTRWIEIPIVINPDADKENGMSQAPTRQDQPGRVPLQPASVNVGGYGS